MKTARTIAALVVAGLLVTGVAWAQAGGGGGGMAGGPGGGGGGMAGGHSGRGGGNWTARLDKNNDGVISKDEWSGDEDAFARMDTNGDGSIDSVEAAAAGDMMRQRMQDRRGEEAGAPDKNDVRNRLRELAVFDAALFNAVDADDDGKLSTQEIQDFTSKIQSADADKDGFVTKEEARKAVHDRLVARVEENFMKQHDTDGDGKVTAEEFGASDDRFKQLDENSDGVVTMDDLKALAERRADQATQEPGASRRRGMGGEGAGQQTPGMGGGQGMGGAGGGQGMGGRGGTRTGGRRGGEGGGQE